MKKDNSISKLFQESLTGHKPILGRFDTVNQMVQWQKNNKPDPEIMHYCLRTPNAAGLYAMNIREKRWKIAEPIIKQSYSYAIQYAIKFNVKYDEDYEDELMDFVKRSLDLLSTSRILEYCASVRKKRWPELETYLVDIFSTAITPFKASITQSTHFYYVFYLSKDWPELEKACIKNVKAKLIVPANVESIFRQILTNKNRWVEYEKVLSAKNSDPSYQNRHEVVSYIDTIQQRNPTLRPKLVDWAEKYNDSEDPSLMCKNMVSDFDKIFNTLSESVEQNHPTSFDTPTAAYAYSRIHGPCPAAAAKVLHDPSMAYNYAVFVLKKRWKIAEPIMSHSPIIFLKYAERLMLNNNKEIEQLILENFSNAYIYHYILTIRKTRWPEFEQKIIEDIISNKENPLTHATLKYIENFIAYRWTFLEELIIQSQNIDAGLAYFEKRKKMLTWPELRDLCEKRYRLYNFNRITDMKVKSVSDEQI